MQLKWYWSYTQKFELETDPHHWIAIIQVRFHKQLIIIKVKFITIKYIFFSFSILKQLLKYLIKLSYIIFYDNLCRTHDSSNSFCWRMGLCANFRRRCLWGVSINYMMLSIFSNYEIQNIYFWDKMWFSKVINSLTEANANMKLGFKLSYKSKYFFSIEQQWLNYWKNRLNFNNLQLPHQT